MKQNLFLLIVLSILLSSCSTNDTGSSNIAGIHFYSLSSLPPTSTSSNKALHIGIGPVEIPMLINRPQIISRKDETEIIMSENHQWGGSHKEEIIQVITDNLSTLLKTENIEQYPWKFTFKPDYQIRINIERFDGEIGKSVTLKARWRLIKNGKDVLVKRAVIQTQISGNSYTDYVKAHNQALKALTQQISMLIKP